MQKSASPKIAMLSLVLLSLACSQSSLLPTASPPGPSGKIIYQSTELGNSEILVMDVRSRKVARLTNNSANDFSPTYISALNKIGFVSDQNNGWGLNIIDMSGANQKEILNNKGTAIDYPNWSPDGKLIAASLTENCKAGQTSCIYDIYTLSNDGDDLKQLTETPESEWVPMWSPDGEKIAFASDRDGDSEIYVMDKDGSNLQQLTENTGHDGTPRWSPDGKKIAFETDRDGGDWDIYIMNPDGTDPQPITKNGSPEFSQAWSPDGNWLVYLSNNDGDNEIFIIDIHGQNQIRLTNNSINEIAPAWAP